ncbi:MAG: hypothetical protein PVH88_20755 [Ignavibacteria bacterium]|jgi:hypothetical protein
MQTEEELLEQLKKLKIQFNNTDTIKPLLEKQGAAITIKGTDVLFNAEDIRKLEILFQDSDSTAKIAQSDVPDNMLSLLTALKAVQR